MNRWNIGAAVVVVSSLSLLGAQCAPPSVELQILHTNDLHSTLRAVPTDPFELGGMAKLSTLLKNLRAANPLTLTLDAGDWSDGTWYYSINTGANMLQLMSLMGFDAVVLGNHDFLSGPARVIDTISEGAASFSVLAANLDASAYPDRERFEKVLPHTMIKTVGDLKVGIIGLTTFEVTYSSYLDPILITNAIDVTSKLATAMRPQVDVLLVVSHNAFETNQQLARSVLGIDAVISGHSHVKTPTPAMIQNAGRDIPVVETGSGGRFVGDLRLEVDRSLKMVRFAGYTLHPVTKDLSEDPSVAQFVEEQDRLLDEKFGDDVDRVVTQSEIDFHHHDDIESPLGVLAAKAYRDLTGSDLGLEGVALTGQGFAKGPVTLMHLHDVIPHLYNIKTGKEWTVQVWDAKGSDLAIVLNIFYHLSALVPVGGPLGWVTGDPLQILWEPQAIEQGPLSRVVHSVQIDGKPLDPQARYRVALSEGLIYGVRLASETFHLGLDLSRVTDTGIEAWRAVAQYAEKSPLLTRAHFGPKLRAVTQDADLSISPDLMHWDGADLSVNIENQGLTRSVVGRIECFSGLQGDAARFDTGDQVWSPLGNTSLAGMSPGEVRQVQLSWQNISLFGKTPVRCDVVVPNDAFVPNNSGVRVF